MGINDSGQIVRSADRDGFIATNGDYVVVDVPPGPRFTGTAFSGISNAGQVVGYYTPYHYFSMDVITYSDNGFTMLGFVNSVGSALRSVAGINNLNQVVGTYDGGGVGGTHGFLYVNGAVSQIDVPGALATGATGINDRGQIVGSFIDSSGLRNGFLDTDGAFTTIAVPGASSTEVLGINDRGDVVGFYVANSGTHGFLERDSLFTTLDVPGAFNTELHGINDSGQIVGTFIPNPSPEPPSVSLFVAGLAWIVFLSRRNASRRISRDES
jgi:uncharacterized membrane protein